MNKKAGSRRIRSAVVRISRRFAPFLGKQVNAGLFAD